MTDAWLLSNLDEIAANSREEKDRIPAREAAKRIRELLQTLSIIDKTLTIPAAEYVPAISDVFTIIDKALKP
jgi:hypothetical protein